jgi:hypothetical protein
LQQPTHHLWINTENQTNVVVQFLKDTHRLFPIRSTNWFVSRQIEIPSVPESLIVWVPLVYADLLHLWTKAVQDLAARR